MRIKFLLMLPLFAALVTSPAAAQIEGTIEGTVTDMEGRILPNVQVVLTGQAVQGQQVARTLADGTYRFRALRPATYNLRFESEGFRTLDWENIIVSGGRTITISPKLQAGSGEETQTVDNASPMLDVRTTSRGDDFDEGALQDVPSATDVWAVLGQSGEIRMLGFDVGGSHKSQQTGYEAYGIRSLNRVLSDYVDTTEGQGGAGFYADHYANAEFTVTASGAGVEMTSPGAMSITTIKGGGNDFSGLFHIDYEGESMVTDNIDDELEARGGSSAPVKLLWEGHADLGGRAIRDKLWFYGAYNHFTVDKIISGQDPSIATDLGVFNNITGKITWSLGERDRFIGYTQYGRKEKPYRGLSASKPAESILAQDSWAWLHKAEWQRIWSDRMFTSFAVKLFGYDWPMTPAVDPATHPSRVDTATGFERGAGFNSDTSPPYLFKRTKPHLHGIAHYVVPNMAGNHDFKFGVEWQVDSEQRHSNANSGTARYFDNSSLGRPLNVDEIQFYSVPADPDNRDNHLDFYAQDMWTIKNRIALTLGVRIYNQTAHYLETVIDPIQSDIFQPLTVPAQTLVEWHWNLGPRLGIAYDLRGDGKAVVKGYFGRFFVNIADTLRNANPGGVQYVRYKFLDPNQNGLYDGTHELGRVVLDTRGRTGGTPVNPDLTESYGDELSFSYEQEIMDNTGIRLTYVNKKLKNDYGSFNRAQVLALLQNPVPYQTVCKGCPGSYNGQTLDLFRVPTEIANIQDPIIDTYPDGITNSYHTVQASFDRRFTETFFLSASFSHMWRNERRSASGESQSPLNSDPISVGFYQNHSATISTQQKNTSWDARVQGRYVFPYDIAFSANVRVQSGWNWAPIYRVSIPGSGTQPIFLENIDNNRSENVPLIDARVEKGFVFKSNYRFSVMLDFYNLLNNNNETNFFLRTNNLLDIIEWVGGRAMKVGFRLTF